STRASTACPASIVCARSASDSCAIGSVAAAVAAPDVPSGARASGSPAGPLRSSAKPCAGCARSSGSGGGWAPAGLMLPVVGMDLVGVWGRGRGGRRRRGQGARGLARGSADVAVDALGGVVPRLQHVGDGHVLPLLDAHLLLQLQQREALVAAAAAEQRGG